MKKILVILALFSAFTCSLFAAESSGDRKQSEYIQHEEKWSKISYVNVPILKVMEAKNAYVVVYQKNKFGIGKVVIPKKWGKGNADNPKKLKFRNIKQSNAAFMTVVKNDGEFYKVFLTLPMNKANPIWGIADTRKDVEGGDKDTLEDLEF